MAVGKEPVDHILRPLLPWRTGIDGAITECGFDAAKVNTLTREEFFKRRKELGDRRTAMLTCMTCSDTAKNWGAWEDDPRHALQREINWERGGWSRARTDRGERLKDELAVIAALVQEHLEEFHARVQEIERRREWLEKKEAMQSKPRDTVRQI